ncbi:MAG: 23S rRNA (guanosine(2251)-2'-O)-methyltransferase RlmB [Deltaproteobacteria bacterium]|nr:23S rRNA (guanosine(2251)-2'-O)-methyltransferase RlmB [Candidatus Zymogenaceae bacterium]
MRNRSGHEKQYIPLEGRNVVLEALRAGREIRVLYIDEGMEEKGKIDEIIRLAGTRGITLSAVRREKLDRMSETGSHQGVIAMAAARPRVTLKELLGSLPGVKDPLLVVLGEVMYEQNVGAILRTADGAGVDGVIIPSRRSAPLSAAVSRISMGASEYIPIIHESPTSALSLMRREGIMIFGVEAQGDIDYYNADLTGPAAFVFGGEDKGLSMTIRNKCDRVLSIPLAGRITSLNVGISVGIVLYEKVRQQSSVRSR